MYVFLSWTCYILEVVWPFKIDCMVYVKCTHSICCPYWKKYTMGKNTQWFACIFRLRSYDLQKNCDVNHTIYFEWPKAQFMGDISHSTSISRLFHSIYSLGLSLPVDQRLLLFMKLVKSFIGAIVYCSAESDVGSKDKFPIYLFSMQWDHFIPCLHDYNHTSVVLHI